MSSDRTAIAVDRVTKMYRIGVGRARVREMTPPPFDRWISNLFPTWWTRSCFNALEDVSFSIASGSSVGIVGHNGAGKTTILKLIADVSAPTTGSIHVDGKIAALLDVVVGFHPELTGRENLGLLGGIYGFDRRQIAERAEQILEFAGIADMIDTPVKRYSAGMVARLGFATITAMDVDVLLIDEVLAVGDAVFQRKCVDWLESFRERGGTLLFVSHNLGLVKSMTERIIWMDHGHVIAEGATNDVLPRYAQALERRDEPDSAAGSRSTRRRKIRRSMVATGQDRWGAGGSRVESVHIEGPTDEGLELDITYETGERDPIMLCVGFVDESGREVGSATTALTTGSERGLVKCRIRPVPLRPGIYFPVVAIVSPEGTILDRWRLERAIAVEGDGPDAITVEFGAAVFHADWGDGAGEADVAVTSG